MLQVDCLARQSVVMVKGKFVVPGRMTGQDRASHYADFQPVQMNAKTIIAVLKPLLSLGAVVCNEGCLWQFQQGAGVTHQVIRHRQGKRVVGAYHIQHVNGDLHRLKERMVRFHSVATHYLKNYLG